MGFSILCSPSYSRKEAKINRGNLKVITIIQIVINAIRQTCDTQGLGVREQQRSIKWLWKTRLKQQHYCCNWTLKKIQSCCDQPRREWMLEGNGEHFRQEICIAKLKWEQDLSVEGIQRMPLQTRHTVVIEPEKESPPDHAGLRHQDKVFGFLFSVCWETHLRLCNQEAV